MSILSSSASPLHAETGQPTRVIYLRRPQPTNLPRFETRLLPGHPGGFEVVNRFGIRVGEFLTLGGAKRSALRLNAAIARALLIDSRPVAEGIGHDHPHTAELCDGPTPSVFEAGPTAQDHSDYVDVMEGLHFEGPTAEDWADTTPIAPSGISTRPRWTRCESGISTSSPDRPSRGLASGRAFLPFRYLIALHKDERP